MPQPMQQKRKNALALLKEAKAYHESYPQGEDGRRTPHRASKIANLSRMIEQTEAAIAKNGGAR